MSEVKLAGLKLLLFGGSLWLIGIAFMSFGLREWSWLPIAGGSFALGYFSASAEYNRADLTEETRGER